MDECKVFDKQMVSGEISNALRCLSDIANGGVLSISGKVTVKRKNCTVLDLLQEKHPFSQKSNLKYVITDLKIGDLSFHPTIFEKISGSEIKRAAMKTNGSHGASGLDAGEWKRNLTYKSSSINLCKTMSKLAIKIASEELNLLNFCNGFRLIALDKCPWFRPIGFGEILRAVIAGSIVKCFQRDLQLLRGNVQMCLGQKSDIEYAMHALQRRFHESRFEGILLIDARNTFISLKGGRVLKNITKFCP